jgi:hypothetical protein
VQEITVVVDDEVTPVVRVPAVKVPGAELNVAVITMLRSVAAVLLREIVNVVVAVVAAMVLLENAALAV